MSENQWRIDLARVLRPYGFIGITPETGSMVPGSFDLRRVNVENFLAADRLDVAFLSHSENSSLCGQKFAAEAGGQLIFDTQKKALFKRPLFRPLEPFISLAPSAELTPLVTTQSGRIVIAWRKVGARRQLVCGFDPVSQFQRYTHGNPARQGTNVQKNLWGPVGQEQPAYLYQGNVMPGYESIPWADRLGEWLTKKLSAHAHIPRLWPLPDRAKGVVLLTGDDDQAQLEKYARQQELLEGFPITYFMMDCTNHTPQTLAELSPTTEFGVHIDALDRPDAYVEACAEQIPPIRELLRGHDVFAIRNHGHLNSGYWGHLTAWKDFGLWFDLNIRGLDGTCPTGSLLPFSVSAHATEWGAHLSLFSTFSDTMGPYQGMTEGQQVSLVRRIARQVERDVPGILVCNFHPQNVATVEKVHRAVMEIGRRSAWRAYGVTTFAKFLKSFWNARLVQEDNGFRVAGLNAGSGVCVVS